MELWSVSLQYGLPALFAVVAGVVVKLLAPRVHLLAPWVHRTIEGRRLRLKHRQQLQQLVNDLRNEIHNRAIAGLWMSSSLTRYTQIRPYLHPEVRKALEASRSEGETPTEKSDETHRRINILEEELARIERDWGLL